jgi:hypothetical protein
MDVPSCWLEHPDIQAWEGMVPDRLDYMIP